MSDQAEGRPKRGMRSGRLEAFTDGVVAIVITIMVLELKVPQEGTLEALSASMPILLAYVLSFINVGLYWNNHHHLMQATGRIDGRVLWANLFLLFWLSLVPFVIRWLDASAFSAMATASYGVVLGMAAIGYELTERSIIACNGRQSAVAKAIGRDWKGKISLALYVVAVPAAFFARPVAIILYVVVLIFWLPPDSRIERELGH
ncbi:MAG: TMEM175 family protein [Sphingobium sp.]|uniref:TMEM175 family protein n=1 Tax=Sphingobium sp. TaxID=1912891 RepID=UPI0029B1D36E|nr:TMEM175 family protein [Sphingobium sp.]MDX3909627.1 TMEM175 family protein [Sphingobium sp.]